MIKIIKFNKTKKISKILGVAFIALAMFFATNNITNSSNNSLDLVDLVTMSSANAEIPIQIGAKKCVCKSGVCSPANFISFRRWCGDPDANNSQFACNLVDNGAC
jgi:hypothetical protein